MSEEELEEERRLEKKRKKAARLEDEFHKNYGKFGLSFELIVNRMRQTIIMIFKQNGLKESSFIEAIIANDTADAVQEKCKMTIYRHLNWSDEAVEVLKPLFVYIRELTNFRNNLMHGTWVPQIAFYVENKLISGQLSRSRSNKPSTVDNLSISSSQLQEIDNDCIEIWGLLLDLQNILSEEIAIEEFKNFETYEELPEYRDRLNIKDINRE